MNAAPQRCLQLDVGNSGAKWRLLEGTELLARGVLVDGDTDSRATLLASTDDLQHISVASVASDQYNAELSALLQERWGVEPWFARTSGRCGELRNSYAEPQRMGVDRWLAMLGARARCKERLCVVDVGSALTIDLVDAAGQHEGGYIIPGAELMERALFRDTERVRYDAGSDGSLTPGNSTAEAVQHGITLALTGAVRMALEEAGKSGAPPVLFVCGGGRAVILGQTVERTGEHVADGSTSETHECPDLVFEGLEIAWGQALLNPP